MTDDYKKLCVSIRTKYYHELERLAVLDGQPKDKLVEQALALYQLQRNGLIETTFVSSMKEKEASKLETSLKDRGILL